MKTGRDVAKCPWVGVVHNRPELRELPLWEGLPLAAALRQLRSEMNYGTPRGSDMEHPRPAALASEGQRAECIT